MMKDIPSQQEMFCIHITVTKTLSCINIEKYNLTCQILYLFSRDHQFKFHKPQSYWRLTWLLILGSVRLIKIHASWPNTRISNNKKNSSFYLFSLMT